MKKFLTVALIVLFVAVYASASTSWSVDFESGFTASSGTPYVFNGDLSNPGDTTKEVHVEADPVNAGNTALDVEYIDTTVPRTFFGYEGLPSFVSPSLDNTVSVDWYNAGPDGATTNRTASLWNLSAGTYNTYSQDRINLYITRTTTAGWGSDIWAYHNYDGGTGYYTKQTVALPDMSEGWHTIALSWDYLGWDGTLGKLSANVELIIDGISYFNGVMGWADFEVGMISVGCRYRGGYGTGGTSTGAHQVDSLERGDLLDNVVITPEPASLMILGIGSVLLRKRK